MAGQDEQGGHDRGWKEQFRSRSGRRFPCCGALGCCHLRLSNGRTIRHRHLQPGAEAGRGKAGLERKRLASIIHGTNVGTWEWNVQTGETVFNERWAQIVGCTLAELSPVSIQTWRELCHPDDLKRSEELLEQHFSGQLDIEETSRGRGGRC